MSGEIPVSAELRDCIQNLRRVLELRTDLNDSLIAVTIGHDSTRLLRAETKALPKSMAQVLPLMLQAIGASSRTLIRLSDSPGFHTRDCYSIARSIVELCANVCFLMTEGPAAAGRAYRHARQKAFTDLNRQSTIGSSMIRLALSGRPSPDTLAEIESDIAEFTSRTGREKGWTDASLDERIKASLAAATSRTVGKRLRK